MEIPRIRHFWHLFNIKHIYSNLIIFFPAHEGVTSYLTLKLQIFAKYVNKWITIATPFQGNIARTLGAVFQGYLTLKLQILLWIMRSRLINRTS